MKNALILVDIQNDFIPGGALAVPDGDSIIPIANKIMGNFDIVIATQDWHPSNHGSFASQHLGRMPGDIVKLNGLTQLLWPDHCIQNTKGAKLVPGLNIDQITKIFHKGMEKDIDSYSGFYDNAWKKDTGLGNYLKQQNIEQISIMGLATDYCVKFTALDARKLGFMTNLIKEGIRGVEVNKKDCKKAVAEMENAGVKVISTNDLVKKL
ncbi:MAG: bifunctional nicotinamidase/pyrazinamidase [Desulfobacteraceae bacterium]|nr:bifunctional nicotinamidase/pyrazinamidase [Desulfobacteraceae bacterium]